jgi:hypothetical protein
MENQMKELNELHKQIKNVMIKMNANLKQINDIERWKIIEGYSNYSVSTHGRVQNDDTGKILAQRTSKYGYKCIGLYKNNTQVMCFVHRLIATAFIANLKHKPFIDHIDNNRINNDIKNLRWSTNSENQMNKAKQSNNTSGVTGVYFEKTCNKWRAQIYLDGIRKHLGLFNTIEEATEARLKAVKTYFGEYAHSSQKT